MTANWETVKIKEITSILGDGLHGTPKYEDDGEYHFINGNNLSNGRIKFDEKTKRCSKDEHERLKKNLNDRTILVSINGTLGNVAYYNSEKVILGKSACYFNVLDSVEKIFVGYVVSSSLFQKYLERIATGTTIKNISLKSMREFSFPLPSLTEQKAIVSVLGALDDKIENNRRMNETLEEMARAIFKSWFVDFDPVRAKAGGKQPAHMDAETAAMFPSSFGDDGLPVGWRQGVFGDIAENPKRTVKPNEVEENTPYIGLEHMPRKSIALSEWEGAEKVSSNKSKFEKGEFLFGKLRPYFHKVGVAAVAGICSTDILVVRPKEDIWGGMTIACISSTEFVNHTDQTSTGTKMPRTNWKDMARFEIAVPSNETAQVFNNFVAPMLSKISTNVVENQTLASMRDTLLPKLMSGEIRVNDAEKEVEAVT